MDHNAIRDMLTQHDVRPSAQRIYIMARLFETRDHPTAEVVYQSVMEKLATLSRTTVYNTMEALAETGVVRVLTIDDNEMRYDIDTSEHGHFRCTACKRVYDFNVGNLQSDGLDGFEIQRRDVFFHGVCDACTHNTTNTKECNN